MLTLTKNHKAGELNWLREETESPLKSLFGVVLLFGAIAVWALVLIVK